MQPAHAVARASRLPARLRRGGLSGSIRRRGLASLANPHWPVAGEKDAFFHLGLTSEDDGEAPPGTRGNSRGHASAADSSPQPARRATLQHCC